MTLKKYLKELLQSLTGTVILIGIKDQTLLTMMKESKQIKQCYFLNANSKEAQKKARWSLRRHANIPISKFRKRFKKKRIDTIVCDVREMQNLFSIFVKDSVYICKGKIYYYGSKRNLDIPMLKARYSRYQVTFEELDLKDSHVFVVDVSKAKYRYHRELWYKGKDILHQASELASDFLVN